jgi:hypothetical protein
MKRKVIASVIGAAALVGLAASSYGQGQVQFNTYLSTGYYPVSYSSAAQIALGVGQYSAGANVDAELGYFVGTSSNPSDFTLIPSTIQALGTDTEPVNGSGPSVGGYIEGGAVAGGIPGVTTAGAPVSFEILAWVASGNGAAGGTYDSVGGYSGSFIWTDSFGAASIGSTAPAQDFTALTGNAVLSLVVPEPTTLALAGLGGLASLMAFRRKKA